MMIRRFTAFIALSAFLLISFGPMPAGADGVVLPEPGTMVKLSPSFNPPVLKGIKVHPDDPFRIDFVLDKGDSRISEGELRKESDKLVKYFLASMTVPEKDIWVNLSPYEKDRIVPEALGQTEMGQDLLAQDYILKQITSSLIYPEDTMGKKFWKRIYEEAERKFGTTRIAVNTFNKVWIVPEKVVIYENAKQGVAYVVESKLKVMLEEDYLSLEKHNGITASLPTKKDNVHALGAQIIREIVLPQLNMEVNSGRNFAQLRQAYNSLVLATWYKKKVQDSILSEVYQNKNKIAGINAERPDAKKIIYEQYLQAFKKGAFNLIREEKDPATQRFVPRKYFSGGFSGTKIDFAMQANPVSAGWYAALTAPQLLSIRLKVWEARKVWLPGDTTVLSRAPSQPSITGGELSGLARLSRGEIDEIPYIVTNEPGHQDIINAISHPGSADSLHIGVSGLQNLDFMAARHSQWGVLIDINRRVGVLHGLVEKTFRDDPNITRVEFIPRFLGLLRQEQARHSDTGPYLYENAQQLNDIYRALTSSTSWLSSTGGYEWIKRMFLEGRVIFIQGDLRSETIADGLLRWMANFNISLDTFYISNVSDWFLDTRVFKSQVRRLSGDRTLILASGVEGAFKKYGLRIYKRSAYEESPQGNARMDTTTATDIKVETLQSISPERLNRIKGEIQRISLQTWQQSQMFPISEDQWNDVLLMDRTAQLSRVAVDEQDKVLGFVLAYPDGANKARIEKYAVAAEFRKMGVGTMLLNKLAQRAQEIGIQSLQLVVLKGNNEAQRHYQMLGFRNTSPFLSLILRYGSYEFAVTAKDLLLATRGRLEDRVITATDLNFHSNGIAKTIMGKRTALASYQRALNKAVDLLGADERLRKSVEIVGLGGSMANQEGRVGIYPAAVTFEQARSQQIDHRDNQPSPFNFPSDLDVEVKFLNPETRAESRSELSQIARKVFDEFGVFIEMVDIKGISKIPINQLTGDGLMKLFEVDSAMSARSPGGIDLTSDAARTVQNSGQGIKFRINPVQFMQLQDAPGFTPLIIDIQPMTDLRLFLGLQTNGQEPGLAKA